MNRIKQNFYSLLRILVVVCCRADSLLMWCFFRSSSHLTAASWITGCQALTRLFKVDKRVNEEKVASEWHVYYSAPLCLLVLLRWKGGLLYWDVAEEVQNNIAGQWDSWLSNHQDDEEPACCSGLEMEPRLGIVFITVGTRISSPTRCCSKARSSASWRPTWRASSPTQESACDSCGCFWRRWLRCLMMSTSCLEETPTWEMQRFVL